MKTIFIMRHGQTDWNIHRRLQGQMDIPLNEEGIAQAKEAGDRFAAAGLRFDTVIASTLSRAVDTAVLSTGCEREAVIQDPRLVEIGYGDYEGTFYSQVTGELMAFIRDPENVPPPATVETIPALMARTGAFLEDLKSVDGESILVVTHGVTIRALMGHLTGPRNAVVWGMPIHNCQLITTTLKDGEYSDAVLYDK